jgi:hypothetical protein
MNPNPEFPKLGISHVKRFAEIWYRNEERAAELRKKAMSSKPHQDVSEEDRAFVLGDYYYAVKKVMDNMQELFAECLSEEVDTDIPEDPPVAKKRRTLWFLYECWDRNELRMKPYSDRIERIEKQLIHEEDEVLRRVLKEELRDAIFEHSNEKLRFMDDYKSRSHED